MMATTNWRDVANALERAARQPEQEADAIVLADPCNYSAEFPATDAALIREAIELVLRQPVGVTT